MKIKNKITEKTNILEALEINPEIADILMDTGIGCIGCSMAHFETLEQGLKAHGLNKNEIQKIIERSNKK